jgi:uncharacterized protein (DUF1697 family)
VNVGRTGKIAMADLRAWVTKLGFVNAQTLLQSGNLVFRGGSLTDAALEQHLEREAEKRLGLQTDFFVRTQRVGRCHCAQSVSRRGEKRCVAFARGRAKERTDRFAGKGIGNRD